MSASPSRTAVLEEGWLPFQISDLWCAGDRRSRPSAVDLPTRPLEGLALHLPAPIPFTASSVHGTIRRLGGKIVPIEGATHCIVRSGLLVSDLKSSATLRRALRHAQLQGICVVEQSWLAEVAKLHGGADWAAVAVEPHVPPVMALLDDAEPAGGEDAASSSGQESSRRDAGRPSLKKSLSETWQFLRRTHPEQVEEDLLAKAIERSLLDFALQLRHVGRGEPPPTEDPYEVLKVPTGASSAAVRAAYRRRALETHPDRGGTPGLFLQVQHAYRRLCEENEGSTSSPAKSGARLSGGGESSSAAALLPAPRVDEELREHRALVEAWFERDGVPLRDGRRQLEAAITELGLVTRDVGATNKNERGELMYNQCFYLSLSRAFLRDDGHGGEPARTVIADTALHFKRVVEAAVLRAHPEWADTQVGEDLQAFSDFLFYVLNGSNALLSELAIAVFDTTSGGVELYRGVHHPDPSAGVGAGAQEQQRANLLCIKYIDEGGGHYQALVTSPEAGGQGGPTLAEMLQCLDLLGVRYVITDGS